MASAAKPAIKVAFWNINLGGGSDENKAKTFSTWCAEIKPDLLILEEGSFTLTNNSYAVIDKLTGMQTLDHVETKDVNSNDTTKQLIALVQKGNPWKLATRNVRLQNLKAIRMVIKVTTNGLEIYGIHANASDTGGAAATEAATMLLDSNEIALVGGDFNYGIDRLNRGNPVRSKRFDGADLKFTQWNAANGDLGLDGVKKQRAAFGFSEGVFVHRPLAPNDAEGAIDYVIHGARLKVTGEKNCANEATWRNIAAFFDHCPVVYTVT